MKYQKHENNNFRQLTVEEIEAVSGGNQNPTIDVYGISSYTLGFGASTWVAGGGTGIVAEGSPGLSAAIEQMVQNALAEAEAAGDYDPASNTIVVTATPADTTAALNNASSYNAYLLANPYTPTYLTPLETVENEPFFVLHSDLFASGSLPIGYLPLGLTGSIDSNGDVFAGVFAGVGQNVMFGMAEDTGSFLQGGTITVTGPGPGLATNFTDIAAVIGVPGISYSYTIQVPIAGSEPATYEGYPAQYTQPAYNNNFPDYSSSYNNIGGDYDLQ